jgi:penicillin-binding protein 2
MAARIATGRAVAPRLVRSANGVPSSGSEPADLGLDPAHLALVRGGMDAVVNDRGGTAWRSRIAEPTLALAGKTGTSQVRQISAAERAAGVVRNADLPWERRDHALFVAYAPVAAPRFAVAVIVEHGGGGSTVAAPIARDLLLEALFGGRPPLSAWPPEVRPEIEQRRGPDPAPVKPGARDRA